MHCPDAIYVLYGATNFRKYTRHILLRKYYTSYAQGVEVISGKLLPLLINPFNQFRTSIYKRYSGAPDVAAPTQSATYGF